jgi:kinesin family protein 3/17
MSTLEGYNATMLAYGQTGTGKTFTMEGFQYSGQHPERGIVPRAMEEIFRFIENAPNMKTAFMVRASYLQIYNEVINDLLKADRANLNIREDKRRGVFVEGLSEWSVRSPSDICGLLKKGEQYRATASTKLNDVSSRSHAVFIIVVEQMSIIGEEEGSGDKKPKAEDLSGEERPKQIKVGKLNLVDLAGSERLSITGATGKRLEECKKINQALSALGNVIAALTDRKPRSHIPYRDSKLTRLLEDSLGGNCKTTMMAMVSPAYFSFSESLSSLKFAHRAKSIKNVAKINEDVDQRALLRKYEIELKKLRRELEEKSKTVLNKELLYKLEQEKRKAEEDKAAAISELETRSSEVLHEKEEKRKLEEKIKSMSSQLLLGGKKIEDTPQFIFAQRLVLLFYPFAMVKRRCFR